MGIVLLYNLTPLLRDYRFFGFSPICSAYRRSCNFVLTSSHFGHSPYVTQGERLRSISLLPCFDFKLRYPVMLRDMAGERCTKPFLFWNKKCRSSSSTVFLQRKNIGEVSRSDGGVNSYLTAKKFMKSFQPFSSETIVSSGSPQSALLIEDSSILF